MATANSIQSKKDDIEAIHAYILKLFSELEDEQAKAYAVASAGSAYVGERDINARSLFDVIVDISADAAVPNALREKVEELVQLACASSAPEAASHG